MHEHEATAAERKALGRKQEAADVAAGAKRYGPAFPRAYNRLRRYASHRVALNTAWQECAEQPHELARRIRECERYARAHGIAWDARVAYDANRDLRRARSCAPRHRFTTRRLGAARPHVRRRPGASSRTSSADPGAGDPDPERPAAPLPRSIFEALHQALPHVTGAERLAFFHALPTRLQALMWDELAEQIEARR